MPLFSTEVFRLVGGNSLLPETFAAKLGERVRLGSPVKAIRYGGSGVTVEYSEFGKPKTMDGDYLVCAMSAVMLSQIPVTPAWPEAKRWAIENVPTVRRPAPCSQSRTKFWREERSDESPVR